jgi:hypothetical protein
MVRRDGTVITKETINLWATTMYLYVSRFRGKKVLIQGSGVVQLGGDQQPGRIHCESTMSAGTGIARLLRF